MRRTSAPSAAPAAGRAPGPNWRTWWLVAAAWWTVDGVTGSAANHAAAAQTGAPVSWTSVLLMVMPPAWLWALATMLALWSAERFPLDRGTWRRHAPVHLAGVAVVCAGRAAFVYASNGWVHWYAELPSFRHVLATSFARNLFLYVILVGFGHAVFFARRVRQREEQLARAELGALKMQLHPHFLFNTLNAITSFVRSDPASAERMIARLSDLLRHALQNAGVHEVPLAEEIGFIHTYLEIEQARFEDRLRVRWRIDPAARTARVPHLLLQPLVENAIRHGIAPRAGGGMLEIEARREGGTLQLVVRDDGVGMDPEAVRSGVGLSNTRLRLAQLYGPRHALRVDGAPGRGVAVSVSVPFEPLAAPAPALEAVAR